MYLSTCVFTSVKTSSLQILMDLPGFFFQYMHATVFKKQISRIQDRCLYCLRTRCYVYTAPCKGMQQLRSQKQSGSSAPQLDVVTNYHGCPVPGAKLGTWCKLFALPPAPLHRVQLPCDIHPWFSEVQNTIISIWSHKRNRISVLWIKSELSDSFWKYIVQPHWVADWSFMHWKK